MEKVKKILNRIIMVFLVLYGYNNLAMFINMTIPINLYTIILISIFGLPFLLVLIVVKLVFF